MSDTPTIIEAKNVRKTYRMGRVGVEVLKGVDLSVKEGEWVAILGASGSGKSTLLHLLGGLDRPSKPGKDNRGDEAGTIWFEDRELTRMPAGMLNSYRCREVGFVFQFYHLLPELRVLENVTVGAMIRHGRFGYRGANRAEAEKTARQTLETFGMGHRLRHKPSELSGGERQRVAIARALVNRPRVLLADEPTGNLDRATGDTILDAIAEVRASMGLTMVMVTHDTAIAARADRVIRLADGLIEAAGPTEG